jgi:hypothetical protein
VPPADHDFLSVPESAFDPQPGTTWFGHVAAVGALEHAPLEPVGAGDVEDHGGVGVRERGRDLDRVFAGQGKVGEHLAARQVGLVEQ